MKIVMEFEKLSFHDASIERIVREGGDILIDLSGVFISREHPQSGGKDWLVTRAILKLIEVANEDAKFWDDTTVPKPHPEPRVPLDEIMHATFESGVFHFDGFKDSVPWYEWFVIAQGFELLVKSADEASG